MPKDTPIQWLTEYNAPYSTGDLVPEILPYNDPKG